MAVMHASNFPRHFFESITKFPLLVLLTLSHGMAGLEYIYIYNMGGGNNPPLVTSLVRTTFLLDHREFLILRS